jgi:hypothetical protein
MTHSVLHHHLSRLVLCAVFAGGGLLLPAPVSTRAADAVVSSAWLDGNSIPAVDGSMADWVRLERVEDGPAVAARNDGRHLYLAVASNDDMVRRQLATGLVVWLDGTGRKAQTFGLRLEGLTRRPLPGAAPSTGSGNEMARDLTGNTLEEFDLLGPGRNQRRLVDRPADAGIALALGVEDGTIVYELAVPLASSTATPHAIAAAPGKTIALGLETPAEPRTPRRSDGLRNPMNTNPWVNDPYGGYFNPPPPTNSGSSRPAKAVEIKPMKVIWVQVELANPPAGPAAP